MKKIFVTFIIGFCILFAYGQSKEYTLNNLPNVRLTDKTQYVVNPDGILSPAATDSINRMLYALEQQTGIETVVAVLPSIGNEDCFDFAFNLGSKWGVGKKKNDNGLVVLLVTDQRCIQIVTGYGLEGDLPDAIAKRIETKYMIPYLRNGDWDNGMVAGVKALCARLDGTMTDEGEEGKEDNGYLLILLAILGFLIIGAMVSMRAKRQLNKCPKCGKHTLVPTDTRLVSRQNGVKTEDVTYTCQNCGHKLIRRRQSYDDDYRGGGGGGAFLGGFLGGMLGGGMGRGGGGGFGGGSFGGGSFGGGGAGSRF